MRERRGANVCHNERMWMVPLVIGWYAVVSAAAFGAYALDKSRAVRGQWRIPERTLHGLALAGGWPGAIVATRVLRHKNRKLPFMAVLWAIAALHVALWGLVLWGVIDGRQMTGGDAQSRTTVR